MKPTFIIARVVIALLLMVGFYLLAIGIAAGLFWIPYAEVVYAHHITPKLIIGCLIAGCAIVWSVLPRFDKFIAPGPELRREKYPELFKELGIVAAATGQEMPAEVYLIPQVNAWVAQRGGIMGFGSRRVMGLGLPLMRALTRSQFRAVLAHEFGHYHGGDTRVGPWIHKTRAAIGRTLASLGRSWMQAPFRWYAKLFLRVTHAVSRRQEFVADELAARTAGAAALIDGLRNVHRVAPAFDYFWNSRYAPALHAGFLPPLSEGFGQFVQARSVVEKMDEQLAAHLDTATANPYDTHPPLKDRIAAVAALPAGPVLAEDLPATSLLPDVPGLERELIIRIAGAEAAAKLKPIDWSEVGLRVYVPQWRQLIALNAAALRGLTPDSLPAMAGNLKPWGKTFIDYSKQTPNDDNAEGLASAIAGAALILLLLERGGRLEVAPDGEMLVSAGSLLLKPFNLVPALRNGELTAETWVGQCRELGIAGASLDVVSAAPEPGH